MGAPNFYTENASKTFIVELDEFSYDDEVANITSALEEIGYEETEGYTGERCYGGRKLAVKSVDITYGNATFTIEITAILRSGYYQHCNLDFLVNIEDYYGYQFDDAHDILEGDIIEMMLEHGYPRGQCKG